MACRRVGKLHAPACEKGVAGDEDCVGPSADKACEGGIDLAAGAGIVDIRLQSHCASSWFDISKRGLNNETGRTYDHGHTSNRWYQFAQELQPFCRYRSTAIIDAGKMTARTGEAGDKTDPDGVLVEEKHNGDACGRRLCRQGGGSIYCNHRHPSPNQIRCELWQSIDLILTPAVHDRDVLSFDEGSIL